MIWQADLASFLTEHLTFMEEQIGCAKTNSKDRLAAFDAARSALVLAQNRLEQEDSTLAAQYALLFGPYSSQSTWTEIAKSEPSEFASETEKLLSAIRTAKGLPQSK